MSWDMEPGVVVYAVLAMLVAALAAYTAWAWRVRERIGPPPPDHPGHETDRFHFKYGGEPPGADGG